MIRHGVILAIDVIRCLPVAGVVGWRWACVWSRPGRGFRDPRTPLNYSKVQSVLSRCPTGISLGPMARSRFDVLSWGSQFGLWGKILSRWYSGVWPDPRSLFSILLHFRNLWVVQLIFGLLSYILCYRTVMCISFLPRFQFNLLFIFYF